MLSVCLHNQSINQVYYFSSTLQARFHNINSSIAYKFKNTSAMLNVNTTKITVVDETRECLSRQMMLENQFTRFVDAESDGCHCPSTVGPSIAVKSLTSSQLTSDENN